MRAWWTLCLGMLCMAMGANVMGDTVQETLYDQYTLQASAKADVSNDLMVVYLQVEHEDKDAKELAEKVNADMAWALAQLKGFKNIESKTQDYRTYPKYSKQNKVSGWRSSQTLLTQSSDFEELKNALQKLQSKLQIKSMQFQPKDDTRKLVEDNLIREALDNFKQRALIVQDSMGAQDYRVMQININTDGQFRPHMNTRATSRISSMESGPAVEAGQSEISVNISAQIQLQ